MRGRRHSVTSSRWPTAPLRSRSARTRQPTDDLQAKFSIVHAAAAALGAADHRARSLLDRSLADPVLAGLRRRVIVRAAHGPLDLREGPPVQLGRSGDDRAA